MTVTSTCNATLSVMIEAPFQAAAMPPIQEHMHCRMFPIVVCTFLHCGANMQFNCSALCCTAYCTCTVSGTPECVGLGADGTLAALCRCHPWTPCACDMHCAAQDKRLSRAEWAQWKPKMPFGQLPVLEVDGNMLAQMAAIGEAQAARFRSTHSTG